MKNVLKLFCAAGLLATVGCDHIRDYSVNSYQGVLPSNDMRPAAKVVAKPSTPPPAPAAAPAAGGGQTTQPASSTK